MLGQLPRTLDVGGAQYDIRSDYRVVLRIIEAMGDDDLTDSEKLLVCLANIYCKYDTIPREQLREAYERAVWFIEAGAPPKKSGPKLLDWTQDEQLIFPAVNAAAGTEVRALPYLHWWTFLGYFQSIDSNSLFGTVMHIRQKRKKGKKLEDWEQDFYKANRELCDLQTRAADPQSALQEIYDSLVKEGAGNGEQSDGRRNQD